MAGRRICIGELDAIIEKTGVMPDIHSGDGFR